MKIYLNLYHYFYFESTVKKYSLLKKTVYFQLVLENYIDRNYNNDFFSPLTISRYDYAFHHSKRLSEKLNNEVIKYMIINNSSVYCKLDYNLKTIENSLLYIETCLKEKLYLNHWALSSIPSTIIQNKLITKQILDVKIKYLLNELDSSYNNFIYNQEYVESILNFLTNNI